MVASHDCPREGGCVPGLGRGGEPPIAFLWVLNNDGGRDPLNIRSRVVRVLRAKAPELTAAGLFSAKPAFEAQASAMAAILSLASMTCPNTLLQECEASEFLPAS